MGVELLMILEVYNKCAVEFMKGWSVSGEIQHINRIQATVPLTGQGFGVIFLRGHISLKNRS
jgi:hypothetical protein